MKIFLVAHHLPPEHRGGVEVHTVRLARALSARGVDVVMVATTDALSHRDGHVTEVAIDGLRAQLIACARVVRAPEDSLGVAPVSRAFGALLEKERPDLVHFQHLLHVGIDGVALAEDRGIKTVLTLHEYWLLCARGGQMIRADHEVCRTAEPSVCATCLRDHRFGRSPIEAKILGGTSRLPAPLSKALRGLLKRTRTGVWTDPKSNPAKGLPAAPSGAMLQFLRSREERIEAMVARVGRVLSPSSFLRQKFIDAGWPRDLIVVSRNGVPIPKMPPKRPSGSRLTVGFLGSVVPQKGLHVIAEALDCLPPDRIRLVIHGDVSFDPGYWTAVERRLAGRAEVLGPYSADGLFDVMAGLDAVVVPSIWYENAPLVISESFAHRRPVIASGFGGMAEMVRDGVDGRLFAPGNAGDLASALLSVAKPNAVAELAERIDQPRSVEEEASDLKKLFEELIES